MQRQDDGKQQGFEMLQQADTEANVYKSLCCTLERYLNPISCRSVLRAAMSRAGLSEDGLNRGGVNLMMMQEIEQRLKGYNLSRARCVDLLRDLKNLGNACAKVDHKAAAEVSERVHIKDEADVVTARRVAREFAGRIGFGHTDQIKIATVVSELARNIFKYAGQGTLLFSALERPSKGVRVDAVDRGPGIKNLPEILSGTYQSKTGMGLGIWGCKNLMDSFSIDSSPESGTQITMELYL